MGIQAPRCPSPERLRQLSVWLDGIISNHPNRDVFISKDHAENEVVNALDWLATHLENRNLYHKKQNLKNRILRDKMKELGLTEEVESLTNDAVFNTVAESEPEVDRPEPEREVA